MDWLTATRMLIIGHRGASAAAPENSLEACALAMDQAADGIEFDVQLSADGHPVIIRLIDPPLHEFMPDEEKLLEEVIFDRDSKFITKF